MKTNPTKHWALLCAILMLNLRTIAQQVPVNMSWIPPGEFTMGNCMDTNEGSSIELPLRAIYLSAFYMDRTEISKALWDEVYVWAINHGYSFDNPGSWMINNSTSYLGGPPNRSRGTNHPVHTINWYDVVKWCNARSQKESRMPAYYTSATHSNIYRTGQVIMENSFVKWNAGYRLPTEAEWEKAARGGTNGHRFPWSEGDTITHSQANYNSRESEVYDTSPTRGLNCVFGCNGGYSVPNTSPVGYFPANGYGLHDMAGNVWEWCWDLYGTYPDGPQNNPLGAVSGSLRILRGGAWYNYTFAAVCRNSRRLPCDPIRVGFGSPSWFFYGLGFRTVLPGWFAPFANLPAPTQEVYSCSVTKQPGKSKLVIGTHGWNPDITWLDNMIGSINSYLTSRSLANWQVAPYKWLKGAQIPLIKGGPQTALENGKQEGKILGDCIAAQGWTDVYMFAHSAGAALIQATAERIRALSPNTKVYCVFLDPFVGFDYSGIYTYGNSADWAVNYFTRDISTGGEIWPFTQGLLVNAHNIDVTPLDPNKITTLKFHSSASGEFEPCTKTVTSHNWPLDFFMNTITGNGVTSDYEGFGFALSEDGNWPYPLVPYTPGNDPAQILGTPDPTCVTEVQLTPATWNNTLIDFTQSPTVQSDTGTILKRSDSSIKLSSGSPVWLATLVSSTNPLNVISFDTEFISLSGAQGLLTVVWDDQVIGSIDERIVSNNHYTFRYPNSIANSSHTLGLRLDSFTNIQSIVAITNIVLNQVGVSQPFSLSIGSEITNGVRIYQLTGEAGFEYNVQSSVNLVDWNDIAVLKNTNGAVRFFDQSSTNYPMRFYRAVAPY